MSDEKPRDENSAIGNSQDKFKITHWSKVASQTSEKLHHTHCEQQSLAFKFFSAKAKLKPTSSQVKIILPKT